MAKKNITHGIFSKLRAIIKKKLAISPFVDAEKLVETIDITELEQEEKDRMLKSFIVAIALNQNNCRAAKRGGRIYVDTLQIKDPHVQNKLLENVKGDEESAIGKRQELQKIFSGNNVAAFPHQVFFLPGIQDGEIIFGEEPTDEEFISVLRELAV